MFDATGQQQHQTLGDLEAGGARPIRRASDRRRNRLSLVRKLQESVASLCEAITATAAVGVGTEESAINGRAIVLNELVDVEFFLRRISTAYGILAPHRKLHSYQKKVAKQTQRPPLDAAADAIRSIDVVE